ncbi:hypothetical protein Hamer_G026070, partial [Homarus americanus]
SPLNTTQHNTTQHNTLQYDTTRHNTTQHNTTQHNTTQHDTLQHNTTQHDTLQYDTTRHNTTQHNTTQHDTLQYDTTQYNTIQYDTAQYDTAQHNKTVGTNAPTRSNRPAQSSLYSPDLNQRLNKHKSHQDGRPVQTIKPITHGETGLCVGVCADELTFRTDRKSSRPVIPPITDESRPVIPPITDDVSIIFFFKRVTEVDPEIYRGGKGGIGSLQKSHSEAERVSGVFRSLIVRLRDSDSIYETVSGMETGAMGSVYCIYMERMIKCPPSVDKKRMDGS